jgi:hypothetical protein
MAPAPILKLRIFVLVLNVFIALVKAWVFMWSKHPEQTGYEWGYPKWKGRFGRENHDWPEKWLMKKKGFYSKLSHEFPSLSAQRTLGPLGPQRENFSSAWKRGPFFLDPEIKGSWAISIIFCTHQKKPQINPYQWPSHGCLASEAVVHHEVNPPSCTWMGHGISDSWLVTGFLLTHSIPMMIHLAS